MASGTIQRPSTLNDNIEYFSRATATTHSFTVASSSQHYVFISSTAGGCSALLFVYATSSGLVSLAEIYKGSSITFTRPEANTFVVTLDTDRPLNILDIHMRGSAIS